MIKLQDLLVEVENDKALSALGLRTISESEELADALANFGLGPKYKPTPRKTYECPKCKKRNATYHEAHADTDMNCMELRCPDCGHCEEE